jgi:uncharacterized protein (TIGR02996 family)
MRTFTFSDAKSHKFWNIELSGSSFTVAYGKIGTAGQTQTKSFATLEKAQAEHDKLVKEKLAKGYVETTSSASKSPRELLEEALRADPNDRAAHAAYADLLMEEGDPQGEFVQVQLALEDESRPAAERKRLQKREKELLKKHEREWLGELAPILLDGKGRTRWRAEGDEYRPLHRFIRGLLAELSFPSFGVAAARALVAAPQTRFVRHLLIGETTYETPGEDFEPGPDTEGLDQYADFALHILTRWKHFPGVRVFRLGEAVEEDYGGDYCPYNCHTSGEQAYHFVKQMPHVEELYLLAHRVDANKLFALPMPELRVLQLYHSNSYPLEKLAANPSLGKLQQVLCHPHALDDEHAYIRAAGIKALVNSPHLRALTHLRLRLSDAGDKGINEIIKSGILKRLKMLDLRHGNVTDAGAAALAKVPELKNLELLDLSRNALTAAGISALEKAGAHLDAAHQHTPAGSDEDTEYLFMGDIE